ncbi:MAG: hypothetical protein VKN72_10325 [Nostocales cyanobacterium 94392]|nr:hypothetical protein [Nostocales cyanobacterium 94392]
MTTVTCPLANEDSGGYTHFPLFNSRFGEAVAVACGVKFVRFLAYVVGITLQLPRR